MVYRFIDDNKKIFGLRWLCNKFGISPNCYYNYKKEAKRKYHKRLAHIYELIKYVYYNNNRVIGYRAMRIFIKRYGYEVSNTTMHKYMNKELNLCAVIMHSKPGYKTGNGALISHICASQMENSDKLIYMIGRLLLRLIVTISTQI